ncbi:hypothetical protein VTI74DRAFT_9612 [Chaetomium olivicolor]
MPPIQLHTKSPINAAKASGATPQTDQSVDRAPAGAATSTSPFQPHPNPTPTRTVAPEVPPPPQPGAVPRLPKPTGTATTFSSQPPSRPGVSPDAGAPPPPAPTPAPIPGPEVQIPEVSYPPQIAVPSPSVGHNQRGTSTATAPPRTAPAKLWGSAQAYQPPNPVPAPSPYEGGPGGYQQNTAGFDQPSYGPGNGGEQEDGFLGSAMRLAKAAGEKLSAAESEVWRRINGESGGGR